MLSNFHIVVPAFLFAARALSATAPVTTVSFEGGPEGRILVQARITLDSGSDQGFVAYTQFVGVGRQPHPNFGSYRLAS